MKIRDHYKDTRPLTKRQIDELGLLKFHLDHVLLSGVSTLEGLLNRIQALSEEFSHFGVIVGGTTFRVLLCDVANNNHHLVYKHFGKFQSTGPSRRTYLDGTAHGSHQVFWTVFRRVNYLYFREHYGLDKSTSKRHVEREIDRLRRKLATIIDPITLDELKRHIEHPANGDFLFANTVVQLLAHQWADRSKEAVNVPDFFRTDGLFCRQVVTGELPIEFVDFNQCRDSLNVKPSDGTTNESHREFKLSDDFKITRGACDVLIQREIVTQVTKRIESDHGGLCANKLLHELLLHRVKNRQYAVSAVSNITDSDNRIDLVFMEI